MNSQRWFFRLPAIVLLLTTGWKADAQCNISPLIAAGYTAGDCRELQFQQVIGTVFNGYGSCGGLDFTPPLTETDIISGSTRMDVEKFVRVYPNPVKDDLFVEADDFLQGHVRIYTLLGSEVYTGDLNDDDRFTLDLSTLANGVYLVKIILDGTRCSTYTIIKS